MIYRVKLFSTGEIVEINDCQATKDRDNNAITKYYPDLHGFMCENFVNSRGYVENKDIGRIIV